MTGTLTYSTTLIKITCWCGCPFAIPETMYTAMQERNGKNCHCPNGHSMVFTETEAEKLRKKLALERENRKWAESSNTALRDQLGATERSLAGHKAAKTRLKNRIAAGACPCCHRTFQNVARHMAGQHPEFASEVDD
jgi:hypothetical protein